MTPGEGLTRLSGMRLLRILLAGCLCLIVSCNKAQEEAETRIADALHLEVFRLSLINIVSGEAGDASHNVAYLASTAMRDAIAGSNVDSESLQDLNDVYMPFTDALLAGLGCFWIIGEQFVCLPLPRLAIKRRPPSIFDYEYEDFEILNYEAHPHIKAAVAV